MARRIRLSGTNQRAMAGPDACVRSIVGLIRRSWRTPASSMPWPVLGRLAGQGVGACNRPRGTLAGEQRNALAGIADECDVPDVHPTGHRG
jgi:hypothetical protein